MLVMAYGSTWNAPKYFQLQLMQCARHHAIFPLTLSATVRECGDSIGHREQIITTVLNIQFDGCRTARGRTAQRSVNRRLAGLRREPEPTLIMLTHDLLPRKPASGG